MNRAEDIRKESVIVRATAAFSGKGNVLRIAFEDIQSDMANDRHVLCGMILKGLGHSARHHSEFSRLVDSICARYIESKPLERTPERVTP